MGIRGGLCDIGDNKALALLPTFYVEGSDLEVRRLSSVVHFRFNIGLVL